MSDISSDAAVKKGHPKGLYLLFVTEMAERFSYYGMRALFTLYLVAAFFTSKMASQIYGSYTGLVYLTPLLGGYIADRYWGNRRSIIVGGLVMALGQFLMFLSACYVNQSIFTEGGSIDPAVDNSLALFLMFGGLVALILGNGFFKPNISTMVGDLYEPTDKRKDAAFTIFYMGINVGAFIAPLVCSTIGEGRFDNLAPFKWGFLAACIAMIFSVVVFWALKDKFLVTPDGLGIGLPPKDSELRHIKDAGGKKVELENLEEEDLEEGESMDALDAFKHDDEKEKEIAMIAACRAKKNSPMRLLACVVGLVGLFVLFLFLSVGSTDKLFVSGSLTSWISAAIDKLFRLDSLTSWISAAIYAFSIILPIFIITDVTLAKVEKKRIFVIYVIALFVIFFWSAFEQAGSSLTVFADRQVDRQIGNFEFKTGWFQSINPIVVVTFAPIMALLWQFLGKRNIEPASPVKQAMGLALLSLGYFVIAFATHGVEPGVKIMMFWLVALYFIHTIGELCLSPIGLSMVNKLAPAHLASLLMGVWFMSNAASNILAGKLAALLPQGGEAQSFLGIEIATLDQFFLLFAIMAGGASILLFIISPFLKKLMCGIR